MDLTHLLEILKTCDYRILAQGNHHRYLSKDGGIKPIMMKVRTQPLYFKDHIVVDRIIGKAAAMLLVRSQVAYVHGVIMSESADAFLISHNIPHSYDELVSMIENRTHTGMCPMEESVQGLTSLEEAFTALSKTIAKLMAQK